MLGLVVGEQFGGDFLLSRSRRFT